MRPFRREPRHDCHCGDAYIPDLDGSCQGCGRFPRKVIAQLNEQRKRTREQRRRKAPDGD